MDSISKTGRLLLAVATAWPVVYMFIFMVGFALMFCSEFALTGKQPASDFLGMPFAFAAVFAMHLLTILWVFGLLAFYIVHLFKTARVPKEQKALWAVVLFLGNAIAMPVYWYFYIWQEPGHNPEYE